MKIDDMIVVGLAGALLVMTVLMASLSLHLPYSGSRLSEQKFKVANSDWCDTLYVEHVRPFRFSIAKYDGTFSCPWPATNTALRTSLAFGGQLLTAAAAWAAYREEFVVLKRLSWVFGVAGAAWLSAATLDANAVRIGNALCLGGFKVDSDGDSYHLLTGFNKADLSCEPGPFVWMVFLDFACVALFAGSWYLWYVYAGDDSARARRGGGESILQDPFLASQGYDSGSPNVDAPEPTSAYGGAV